MRSCIFGAALAAGLALSFAAVLAQKPASPVADEEAIRKAVDAYAAAYNKGDLATVMTFWADGAEFVDESGAVTRGKDAIAALFKKGLTEHKGRTLNLKIGAPRLLRPDLATLDGTVGVKNPDGADDTSSFTSVWVRAGGAWQILSVRDLPGAVEADVNPPPPSCGSSTGWSATGRIKTRRPPSPSPAAARRSRAS